MVARWTIAQWPRIAAEAGITRRGRAVRAVLLAVLALLLALWLAPNRGGMSLPPYTYGAEMGR